MDPETTARTESPPPVGMTKRGDIRPDTPPVPDDHGDRDNDLVKRASQKVRSDGPHPTPAPRSGA